jgi:hypothetical protein
LEQTDVGYVFRRRVAKGLYETTELMHLDVNAENVLVNETSVC